MSLLTTKQAAPILGCAINTLIQSRVSGILFGVKAPQYKKMGSAVRYEKDHLLDWLKQFNSQTSTKQNT